MASSNATPRRVTDPDAERVAATRTLLLDTAERLLVDARYEDLSARAITSAAGVNPAAIQFHFGSKQGLMAALLEARFADIVARTRLASDAMLADTVVDLVDLVRLQVEPLVELGRSPGLGRLYVRLLARAYLERWEVHWDDAMFQTRTWVGMVARALPEAPWEIVAARWLLATEFVLAQTGRPLEPDVDGEWDLDAATLIAFVVGGLRAPWTEH